MRSPGFSHIEALIALLILVSAMAMALSFFVDFGAAMNTESGVLAMQQSGRLALDELARNVRQAGYGVRRSDNYNPANWQRAIVYAGPHTLAFNADIDPTIGPIPSTSTISFPTGPAYSGEGIGLTTVGAETYLYTVDADADAAIEVSDRVLAGVGSYNPAAETPNPWDFGLFRSVHGYDGTGVGGTIDPLAANLFTNATADITYPEDGGTPEPLFTYWLTEDLDGDGLLSDFECVNDVIDSCPPTTGRPPLVYLWGDTDFDGSLSESEKVALRSLEVGAPTWSKNVLATAGNYRSTFTTSAIDPEDLGSAQLEVGDGTALASGYHVELGDGPNAEQVYIEQVWTASLPHRVYLGSPVRNAHAAGAPLRTLPSTLLRAVRAVGLTYTTISGRADSVGEREAPGRSGRRGTRGLDYRVTPFHRKIEVINMPTLAMARPDPANGDRICPLSIVNACSNLASEAAVRYSDLADPQFLGFVVTDTLGNVIPGVSVAFSNTDTSIGSLGATADISDLRGMVTVDYIPTGQLGTDRVTATVGCTDANDVSHSADATNDVTIYRVEAQLAADCLSTVSPRTPSPAATFGVEVQSASGPVSGHEIELGLEFDPDFLPSPPDFATVRGELEVDGSPFGVTGNDGVFLPEAISTDGAGLVRGTIRLASDASGSGARLQLVTRRTEPGCGTKVGEARTKVDFLRLSVDSSSPTRGCTELSPCTIGTTTPQPEAEATLTLNGQPIPLAPVTFTTTDINPPSNGDGVAASLLVPSPVDRTNDLGIATATVTNNGSSAITPATPLRTRVDATSSGSPTLCSNGSILSSSHPLQFNFEEPEDTCAADAQQAWVSRLGPRGMCLHVMNATSDSQCEMEIQSVRLAIYTADGASLDPAVSFQNIDGGGVSPSASCGAAGSVPLFATGCRFPPATLANGRIWRFTSAGGCDLPPDTVPSQSFFAFSNVQTSLDYPRFRPMDVTVAYACTDPCAGEQQSMTFRLATP